MTANITPGTAVTLTLVDGSTLAGLFVSQTSKGYNIKVDGKTVTRATSKVERVDVYPATPDLFDGMTDDAVLTTAALAALFDTSAKALRVELRRAGLGVGKGSTYALTPATVRPYVVAIRDGLAARAS